MPTAFSIGQLTRDENEGIGKTVEVVTKILNIFKASTGNDRKSDGIDYQIVILTVTAVASMVEPNGNLTTVVATLIAVAWLRAVKPPVATTFYGRTNDSNNSVIIIGCD